MPPESDLISISKKVAKEEQKFAKDPESMSRKELEKLIAEVKKKMEKAAAEPGIKQSEIIIDFRYRPHRGTGIAVGTFLVNGYGRGKAFYFFHLRLFSRDKAQERHSAEI